MRPDQDEAVDRFLLKLKRSVAGRIAYYQSNIGYAMRIAQRYNEPPDVRLPEWQKKLDAATAEQLCVGMLYAAVYDARVKRGPA